MSKISNWKLNQIDNQGNIISGYQDIAKNVTREQAITDYLYYLETSERVKNPKCDCIEIDWKPNTVKLYKINQTKAYQMSEQGEGYSLEPYFSGSNHYEGYDDGGKDYILPEGYEVGESTMDELQIYSDKGEYCQIIKKFNSPCLIMSEGEIMLAKAK